MPSHCALRVLEKLAVGTGLLLWIWEAAGCSGSGIWENLIVLLWEQPSLWENLGAGVVGEQVWENLVFASGKRGTNTC